MDNINVYYGSEDSTSSGNIIGKDELSDSDCDTYCSMCYKQLKYSFAWECDRCGKLICDTCSCDYMNCNICGSLCCHNCLGSRTCCICHGLFCDTCSSKFEPCCRSECKCHICGNCKNKKCNCHSKI